MNELIKLQKYLEWAIKFMQHWYFETKKWEFSIVWLNSYMDRQITYQEILDIVNEMIAEKKK